MNASEIMQRLTPERQECIKSLMEQTRIARSHPKSMPVPSSGNRYASPVLTGTPEMVRITSEKATEVLARCKMYPRQSPIDEEKLQTFIELIKTGEWKPEKRAPIMITKNGICLNGRHRLNALSQSGCSAMMPVLDRYGIIIV